MTLTLKALKTPLITALFSLTPFYVKANSKQLFNSFQRSAYNQEASNYELNEDSEFNFNGFSDNSELNQKYLKKAFARFIKALLKKDVELSDMSFDEQTASFLNDPTSLKAHIRVLPDDIIDPVNRLTAKTKMIWVKPYLRDVFFQTRTMVCKYSYRSKYRKPRKSLSGHFIHENHGSLLCKDIESGERARPFVFGNKKLLFIAELIPQKEEYNKSQITSFKTNDSKRNKTFY